MDKLKNISNSSDFINRQFYSKLYKKNRFRIWSILKAFLSFDQQSKSKINLFLLKKYIDMKKTCKVLDFGFGRGSLILKMPKNYSYFGCEISESAVKNFPKIANLLSRKVIAFKPEDINQHVLDHTLDLIVCSHVLEHVPDDMELIKLFSKKIVSDGKILINVPINELWDDPKHVRKYTFDDLKDIAQKTDLCIIEHLEVNRIDNFLINNEVTKTLNPFMKICFIGIRVFFAILPLNLLELLEKVFFKNYKNGQMLCILMKKNSGEK